MSDVENPTSNTEGDSPPGVGCLGCGWWVNLVPPITLLASAAYHRSLLLPPEMNSSAYVDADICMGVQVCSLLFTLVLIFYSLCSGLTNLQAQRDSRAAFAFIMFLLQLTSCFAAVAINAPFLLYAT